MRNNHHHDVFAAATGPATNRPNATAVAIEPMVDLMLDVKQVAKLLHIGVRTVWRLADRGELPAPVPIGGRRLWHRPTLEAFIKTKAEASVAGVKGRGE